MAVTNESAPSSIQADKTDDNHACCRYVSDHKPINCNAARQRYTSDYLDVQLANSGHTSCAGQYTSCPGSGVYAYSHFMQQGMADHRVWHSELCKADGTDRNASTDENGQARAGLGRIVALSYCSSTSCQSRLEKRCLFF